MRYHIHRRIWFCRSIPMPLFYGWLFGVCFAFTCLNFQQNLQYFAFRHEHKVIMIPYISRITPILWFIRILQIFVAYFEMKFLYLFPEILLHDKKDCCTYNSAQQSYFLSHYSFLMPFPAILRPTRLFTLPQLPSESYAASQRLRITKRNFASSVNHIGKLVFHTLL